jgi:acyl-CoA-dependent ceramide synthase
MDHFFDPNRLPSFLVPFVSLSYPVDPPQSRGLFPASSYYGIGYLDVCLIVSIIAIMAILRDAARLLLLEPFANWKLTRDWRRRQAFKSGSATPESKTGNVVGINNDGKTSVPVTTIGSAEKLMADRPAEHSPNARRIRHSVARFAEQGWLAIYYLFQWSLGIVRIPYHLLSAMRLLMSTRQYIHYHLPSNLWAGYPHTPLAGIVKFYYLLQISLYVHLVLLLNAEAPRKDHWQMMAHHVVTITLIVASYAYNFTRAGCLIMVLMDWCDVFFPVHASSSVILGRANISSKVCQDVAIPFVPDRLRHNFCVVDAFVVCDTSRTVLYGHRVHLLGCPKTSRVWLVA